MLRKSIGMRISSIGCNHPRAKDVDYIIYIGHLGVDKNRGVTVTYDTSKVAGSRIVSITINGEVMDQSASYTLATMDFIVYGGDEHIAFADIPTQNVGFDTALLSDYIKELGMIDESKIPDGRQVSVCGPTMFMRG